MVHRDDTVKQADLVKELKRQVKTSIAGFAVPDHVMLCSGLPKTRSGKIMRRILRKIAAGDYANLGVVSTLAEPQVVEKIANLHQKLTNKV